MTTAGIPVGAVGAADTAGTAGGTTALFIGDSITDAGRRTDPSGFLGAGYVRHITELDPGEPRLRVVNRGISGNRARDLRERWATDCLDVAPGILTILVGVNDTWRRYDSDDPTDATAFARDLEWMIATARDVGIADITLMEPFLVPLDEDQARWRAEDLDEKIDVVRTVAATHGTALVPLDGAFTEQARLDGPLSVIDDGVHPSAAGHELIARLWWQSR